MKVKILITLLAVAAVAGCSIPSIPGVTQGTTITGVGKGLEITSFTVEPDTVFSRSVARVDLEAQNMGGSTVPNDSALVYLTGSDVNLGDTGGTYWYGKSAGDDQSSIRHFQKNMTPEDVVTGAPANVQRFVWNLIAPNVTQGQTRHDSFIARVYNDYSSGANGNIWVYTDAEAQSSKSSGKLETSSFTSIPGPVAVSVKLSPDPVVLYGDEKTFTFSIEITNSATGTIYRNNTIDYTQTSASLSLDSENDLNWVNVGVDAPDLTITDCTGDQQILGSKSLTLICTATIDGTVQPFQSYPVNVIVKYGYYTQSEVTITVQGR